LFKNWKKEVTKDFFQLHYCEEELNRIFIDIYDLQDELTADVSLKDITILQDEIKKNDLEALEEKFRFQGKDAIELPIDRAEVISQFISYAIGLFMGRYRLDKPGLNIAHPNPTRWDGPVCHLLRLLLPGYSVVPGCRYSPPDAKWQTPPPRSSGCLPPYPRPDSRWHLMLWKDSLLNPGRSLMCGHVRFGSRGFPC
jgi:hypothetical protein